MPGEPDGALPVFPVHTRRETSERIDRFDQRRRTTGSPRRERRPLLGWKETRSEVGRRIRRLRALHASRMVRRPGDSSDSTLPRSRRLASVSRRLRARQNGGTLHGLRRGSILHATRGSLASVSRSHQAGEETVSEEEAMKKATRKNDSGKRRGRPTKSARDSMVPMSVSVPAPLRDLIDSLRGEGETRSVVALEVLEAGIARVKRKRGRA